MKMKRAFFFRGPEYWRFDVAADAVPGNYPRQISGPWPGLFTTQIDAAFPMRTAKVYFFSGDQYIRYDALLDRADANYPKPIAGNWPVAGTGFEHGIDAALNWGNGQYYWFKGDQYLRLTQTAGTWVMDGDYPKAIGPNWPGVAGTGFEHGIDGAINWGNNQRYWFRGDQYIRLSEDEKKTKKMDAGYPKPIAGNWSGVPVPMDGCVEWPSAEMVAGTFAVPTNRGGWGGPVPLATGANRWGERFEMQVDFTSDDADRYPTMAAAGEFRQYVRGVFSTQNPVTGAMDVIEHHLPNMAGGAPILMLGAPAAGVATDNFLEDGHVGGHWQYGHRRVPDVNPGTHNQFLPDRGTGDQFRGTDLPSLSGPPGTPYSVALDFRANAVDSATAGQVLATNDWSVTGSGAF